MTRYDETAGGPMKLLHHTGGVSLWVECRAEDGAALDYSVVDAQREIRFATDWKAAFACYENLAGRSLPRELEPLFRADAAPSPARAELNANDADGAASSWVLPAAMVFRSHEMKRLAAYRGAVWAGVYNEGFGV